MALSIMEGRCYAVSLKLTDVYTECLELPPHAECQYAECHYAECRGALPTMFYILRQ